jgi:hypothetical protein
MTLKAMSYVSEMRSNLSLMRRSRHVSVADIRHAHREVDSYLAQRVLIYPHTMRRFGLVPDMTFQQKKEALSLSGSSAALSEDEIAFQSFLESSAAKSRRAMWIWRIGSECEEMRDLGWFPFFVTLTVDPSRVPDSCEMWKEGREFRRYIRRLAKVSSAACGMPSAIQRGASDSDFVRHVGVIEHGSSRHHHHMHLLIWMRDIPDSWKIDPNRGIVNPKSRTINFCRQMGTYWPHALPGIGRAIFFRHEGDVWSRLGFCLPFDKKRGRAILVKSARRAGVYVSKYMEKEHKAWLHRVKATRDLGKGRLRNLLHRLPLKTVQALSHRPRTWSLALLIQTIHNVPQGFLRSMAKQVSFCRQWASDHLDTDVLLRPSSAPYTAMLQSVRDGQRPSRMSSEDFYDWVTQFLPVPDGYCERATSRAHLRLLAVFPPCREQPVNHFGGLLNE